MRKLVLDIGNSRLKWAVIDNQQLSFGGAYPYRQRDFKELASEIWQDLTVDHVAVANVGGDDVAKQLRDWVADKWQLDVQFLLAGLQSHGVKNGYATPFQLGVDRWASVIGAWQQHKAPVCVYDCGTAITVDVVDDKGQLLGGTISPGMNLMVKSLVSGADGLKDFANNCFDSQRGGELTIFAKDTRSAILNGCLLNAVSFMECTANELRITYPDMKFLVTGGDSELLMPYLSEHFQHNPFLVLEGVDVLST
tara:strand:- start:3649 stop:4404 length:756 start_codon:yes stop_codon:yes gene_type:complete